MEKSTDRFAARGEYEELKERETDSRILLRTHAQALHQAVPVPDLRGDTAMDICEIRTAEAEVHLRRIGEVLKHLEKIRERKQQLEAEWEFERARR